VRGAVAALALDDGAPQQDAACDSGNRIVEVGEVLAAALVRGRVDAADAPVGGGVVGWPAQQRGDDRAQSQALGNERLRRRLDRSLDDTREPELAVLVEDAPDAPSLERLEEVWRLDKRGVSHRLHAGIFFVFAGFASLSGCRFAGTGGANGSMR
jgi:hypothetical protein